MSRCSKLLTEASAEHARVVHLGQDCHGSPHGANQELAALVPMGAGFECDVAEGSDVPRQCHIRLWRFLGDIYV